MKFKKRLLIIFIPLSIVPILITVVIFNQISSNELIKNEKTFINYHGNSVIERASKKIQELKDEHLFDSMYFRERMFGKVIDSSIFREDDIICIFNEEKESLTAGSAGFFKNDFKHEDLRKQINEIHSGSVVEVALDSGGNLLDFVLFSGKISGEEKYLVTILVPVDTITAPLLSAMSAVIPVLIIMVLIVFIIILRISAVFTRPLTKLMEGVENISRGRLDLQLVEDQKTTEFRILLKAFNKMSKNLNNEMNNRKKFEKDLQASLNEKDVLLNEIHHRVKNNMQIISSLLKLQSDSINDEEIIDEFNTAINRINTMALVHERLYQSKDFTEIDFESYLDELFPFLLQSYSRTDIIWSLDLGHLMVSLDQIISLGLIINELISNTIKHAPNYPGAKKVSIKAETGATGFIITYQDWGDGPQEIPSDSGDSFGLNLVKNLAIQLGGTYRIESRNGHCLQLLTISAPAG